MNLEAILNWLLQNLNNLFTLVGVVLGSYLTYWLTNKLESRKERILEHQRIVAVLCLVACKVERDLSGLILSYEKSIKDKDDMGKISFRLRLRIS